MNLSAMHTKWTKLDAKIPFAPTAETTASSRTSDETTTNLPITQASWAYGFEV
jgi:hypothetical protein